MAALSVQVPYPVFYDRDGQPLDNGNIYIGVANLDPVTNPIQVYYDEALTIPASQPLKTSNGYIYRNGTPAQLYVNAVNFSILVNDAKNTLVYSFPDGTGISPNASGIIYNEGSVGAVNRTAQDKMRETVTLEDYGAIPNTVSSGAANANKAALRSAVAWAKANGGGAVQLTSGNDYYMGTAVGDTFDSMCVIDFENFSIIGDDSASFSTAANNAVSYFFYVKRGKFSANQVILNGADGPNLNQFGTVGPRLFCITDDDSLGLSDFEINGCEAYGIAAHTVVFPKNGSGVQNITGRENYAEECTYGLNTSASVAGSGPVDNVDFEINGKNVYRLAFGFGHGSNISIVARQAYGHNRTALGNGTVINWSIPKVAGFKWKNLNLVCQSDEDWARGILLSIQTDNADVAASGALYPNRGFECVNVDVNCSRGKYSGSGSTDYAFYMGQLNTDTGNTVTTALATTWQDIFANVVSPSDLSLGRLPITPPNICVTTAVQKGNALLSTAELSSVSQTLAVKQLSNLFSLVSVAGRTMLSNEVVIRNDAGTVKTILKYDDPHLEVGSDDDNLTRWRAGSGHVWYIGGALTANMTAIYFRPWVDNTMALGGGSNRWSVVYAATGTINTSDRNQKQDIFDLDAAEKRVAVAIKALVKKFRFKDAVALKGDDARIHVGVIAQDVEAAFEAEGLDPERYGIFCKDKTKNGSYVYGVRYEELLAFVIAAL